MTSADDLHQLLKCEFSHMRAGFLHELDRLLQQVAAVDASASAQLHSFVRSSFILQRAPVKRPVSLLFVKKKCQESAD